MEIKQAIEMTEELLVDNEKGIDSLGKYGDEVAVKLLSKVNELQEDNNACACEIAVLKHLLREKTAEAEQLIEQAERARLLEVHWRSEIDRHAEPFNKMGRTLDKINKMIRRGFVNLGDELNYEIKDIMEGDK